MHTRVTEGARPFCSRPIFRAARMRKTPFAWHEFRSLRTGTLATQATLLSECQFSGNVKNIPAVLQPSSTCQWLRLLTVRCQRFMHQPIVFLRCEANAYFIVSGCVGSLSFSFRAAALFPRVSRLALKRKN